jgi:hypothetical protein
MALVKRIGWVLVGLVIGVSGAGALSASGGVLQERPQPRLVAFMRGDRIDGYNAYFIKDTKTGGCWLSIRSGNADGPVALAPASPASCEQ